MSSDGKNVIDIAQFFVAGNECHVGCWIFLGVWLVLFVICLLYQYEVCSKGGKAAFSNIDDDATSDDDAEHNLLQDV